MARNAALCRAKVRDNDEFYTQLADIEAEMSRHLEENPDIFLGKVVYCPCDHPERSMFVRYFLDNFHRLGFVRLLATSYDQRRQVYCAVSEGHHPLGKMT